MAQPYNPYFRAYRREKKNFIDEHSSSPRNVIVVRTKRMFLELKDLLVLNSSGFSGWFSGDLIDTYLNMCLWSSNISMDLLLNCFVFDSYFYQRLPKSKHFEFQTNILNAHGLGRHRFEDCKKLFMPININDNHWLAVMIDRSDYIIRIFDSLNPHKYELNYTNSSLEENLRSFLDCKIPGPQFESSRYRFEYVNVTQQIDNDNCGPFVILNILDQINLIHFCIENSVSFFRNFKLIMFNELIQNRDFESEESYESGFILNLL